MIINKNKFCAGPSKNVHESSAGWLIGGSLEKVVARQVGECGGLK